MGTASARSIEHTSAGDERARQKIVNVVMGTQLNKLNTCLAFIRLGRS